MTTRIAACGGVYSNPYALRAFLADASRRGANRLFCLGDFGGFGAEPDAIWPLLTEGQVECIAGNYELAIGHGQPDCGCGYRDPIDNEFAQIMYDFTRTHTSSDYSSWMTTLPTERRERIAGSDVHLVHGSPLAVNDFWWESLTDLEHQRRVDRSGGDVILCTHSGLPWQRRIGGALVVNVGVLGRPANDGSRDVWYAIVDIDEGQTCAELVPLRYDWEAQAASMRRARLPDAFAETVETGWWTTCLEVLPPVERSRGRYHVYQSSMPALLREFGLRDGDGLSEPSATPPVVSLFGTPLFPARLWIDLGASRQTSAVPEPRLTGSDVRSLVDEASTEGFTELAICGDPISEADTAAAAEYARRRIPKVAVRPYPARRGDGAILGSLDPSTTIPELMITGDAFYWSPVSASDRVPPGAVLAHRGADEQMSLAEAKRIVTQRFLEYRRADHTLASAPICAA